MSRYKKKKLKNKKHLMSVKVQVETDIHKLEKNLQKNKTELRNLKRMLKRLNKELFK